jgi:hypothetical protein
MTWQERLAYEFCIALAVVGLFIWLLAPVLARGPWITQ